MFIFHYIYYLIETAMFFVNYSLWLEGIWNLDKETQCALERNHLRIDLRDIAFSYTEQRKHLPTTSQFGERFND